jgi:hypothetical protein
MYYLTTTGDPDPLHDINPNVNWTDEAGVQSADGYFVISPRIDCGPGTGGGACIPATALIPMRVLGGTPITYTFTGTPDNTNVYEFFVTIEQLE